MMIFKKVYIIMAMLLITIILLIVVVYHKVVYLTTYNELFPTDETITINLSEIPQIPWDTSRALAHVIETFTASVNGSLISIEENFNENEIPQNTLLDKYTCDYNYCFATLKKNIFFHNNREVTAYDVEFSLIRQLILKNKNKFIASILDDIVGIDDLKSKKIKLKKINSIYYPTGLVKGIEVVDKYNINFKLKRTNNLFFNRISIGRLPIVPIEEFDPFYNNWLKHPIGFGKYKIESYDLNSYEFVLKKFNEQENIPRYIKFIFSNKNKGDIKILLGNLTRGNSKTDRRIVFPSIYTNGGFFFNHKTLLGANAKFREAISLALDRELIASKAHFKEIVPENQMIPIFSSIRKFRANIPIEKRNIKRAKLLLNEVPHYLWKNRVFHVHTYWANIENINSLPYIQEIISQLRDVGIYTVFYDTDINYNKFKYNDTNVLLWSGFSFPSIDPNKNFAYFRKNSFLSNESPPDNIYEKLYKEAVENSTVNSEYTKRLSEYFVDKKYFVVVLNQRMSFAYNSERIASLGEQHNGYMFYVWKLKLK
ncbi:ABC transporter substrate-binding protein [Spirobacillus cienkowskii]|uniref:ABC transporter substrate-binding protein n=1 Tax=Spirobacillus cienkowskii TaxID=495820 RepID=UPI0030D0606A